MMMTSCLVTANNGNNKPTVTNSTVFDQYCVNGHKNYYSTDEDSSPKSDTRIVKLRRVGNSPLGFSLRGGWEHGTGIFVSEVHPGSEAEREGLKPGDQILRVNGFIIEQAIHDEVITLIRNSPRITLKVKSVGMIPIKSNCSESLSWKLVELPPTCQTHNWKSSISNISPIPFLDTADGAAVPAPIADKKVLYQDCVFSSSDYIEAKIFIRIARGQNLGCSVVKGPASYPGIFVQSVRDGGIAQESGLEVGDQIIAMNGVSFEPDYIEFTEAIAKIKSCQHMTLTVRKKSGLSLFHSAHQRQMQSANRQAHGHHHSSDPTSPQLHNMKQSIPRSSQHPSLCYRHSSESSSTNSSQFLYAPSEHDYSLSEVESNAPARMYCDKALQASEDCKSVHTTYDKVKKEGGRIAEGRKKLESEQKRLQGELEKLEKERKQLETRKPNGINNEDVKSISSGSISGSQSISSSSGSVSQVCFLEEIKRLAERRTDENGLITDTLNKTKNLERIASRPIKNKSIVKDDDETRKRHELLMEEFRAAHMKMFGQNNSSSSVEPSSNALSNCDNESDQQCKKNVVDSVNPKNAKDLANKMVGSISSTPSTSPAVVSIPSTETVTILRTASPAKKLPPPPVPPSRKLPLVTFTEYGSDKRNRFITKNDSKNNKNNSGVLDTDDMSKNIPEGNMKANNDAVNKPVSIKINLK